MTTQRLGATWRPERPHRRRGCLRGTARRRGPLVLAGPTESEQQPQRLWNILEEKDPPQAWRAIFGNEGERGEYMDAYSKQAMFDRCLQDYQWEGSFSPNSFQSERAKMMAHVYADEQLWEHVSMVGFAEHYVLEPGPGSGADLARDLAKPLDTFRRRKSLQPEDRPIFSGVVLTQWEDVHSEAVERKISAFKQQGVEYVRMHCDFGSVDEIAGPAELADNPRLKARFERLAEVARACQRLQMVPLALLQVPWREPGDDSQGYFRQAVASFAEAVKQADVDPTRLLLETRPPIGISAQEETGLEGTAREALGLETGLQMFEVLRAAFPSEPLAGYCVAGGSTKGAFPTAMEDDTQNAVRQGIRRGASAHWGYEGCFWEMGAKLMLQPEVGQLWGRSQGDAARALFCLNAKDLAKEIVAPLSSE